MSRKLVTTRPVSEIREIPGADNICLAIVDGWQCVVKKGEFKVGDVGLYFEIDSFVPASDQRFKFLEKNFITWQGHYGARIRTIKLKGQISQGLLMPKDMFPEVRGTLITNPDWAESIGVLKWEPQQPKLFANGKQTKFGRFLKKLKYTKLKPFITWLEDKLPRLFVANVTMPFPNFIPKTDEERVQNLVSVLVGNPNSWNKTVKLDGSSMTVYRKGKEVGVCSRNLKLAKTKDNKYWSTALKYKLPDSIPENYAIQGELMGPGIQGNKEELKEYDYFVFKIWDIDNKKYLDKPARDTLCIALGLKQVPYLGSSDLVDYHSVDDFLKEAEGPSLNSDIREGIVYEKYDGTFSFKAISNTFLLKYKG